jgi:hypothetical protein
MNNSILEALIAPQSLEEFFSRYWPDHYYATHGDLVRLPQFFQAPDLKNFQALSAKYRGRVSFGSGPHGSRTLNIDRVSPATLFEMGLSVYLPDIASAIPGAAAFLKQLEQELGVNDGCARIGAFASPKDDGISCHFDAEEVFSVQLQGSKRFHVAPVREVAYPSGMQWGPGIDAYDDMYPQMAQGFPDLGKAEFATIEMKPGSVLFMPRGTWHRTEASENSFSVSIILRPPTAAECVLEQLRLMLLQDTAWRRPLYGAWGEGSMRAAALANADKLLSELPHALRALSAQDVLQHSLSERKRLDLLCPETRLQKTPSSKIEFEHPHESPAIAHVKVWDERNGERITVSLEAPPAVFPVLSWLSERNIPFRANELERVFPEQPFNKHRKLLEVLIRGGFLKMLWFAPLPGSK